MAEKFRARENYEFPLDAFSSFIYQLVLDGQAAIDQTRFGKELAVMDEERMVVNRGNSYTFRHDKIRDFFLAVAMKKADGVSKHYGDPRFLSAYLSLALQLPPDQARDLREDVEDWALDYDDRSLADELGRALRRKRGDA